MAEVVPTSAETTGDNGDASDDFHPASPCPHNSLREWGRYKSNEHGAVPNVPSVPKQDARRAEDEPKLRGSTPLVPIEREPQSSWPAVADCSGPRAAGVHPLVR